MSESSLYQELTKNQLRTIINEHFNITQFDYSLLEGGMFNTTYLISLLPANQQFVLRVGPINRHLLLPFEYNLMNGEKYFYDLCEKLQVPTSKVVVCNTDKQIVDRDYMIVAYIKSCPLSKINPSETEKNALYEDVGRYSAMIHSVLGGQFGRLSQLQQGKGYSKWSEYLKNELAEWVSLTEKTALFTSHELEKIKAVFIKYADILDEITVPHLVHADLWEGNILVSGNKGDYKIAAIIDGDRSIFGDIEYEFASEWMINDSFLKGYATTLNMDTHNLIRRKLYSLIFNLTDAYVCSAEYNNEQSSLINKNSALELVDDLYNLPNLSTSS